MTKQHCITLRCRVAIHQRGGRGDTFPESLSTTGNGHVVYSRIFCFPLKHGARTFGAAGNLLQPVISIIHVITSHHSPVTSQLKSDHMLGMKALQHQRQSLVHCLLRLNSLQGRPYSAIPHAASVSSLETREPVRYLLNDGTHIHDRSTSSCLYCPASSIRQQKRREERTGEEMR